ncbi:lipocalin-like domain-containing protein [Achromobacter piechaudii]|nr:lipocalin-like domain-containing protein [Achromobacter piechaudii]
MNDGKRDEMCENVKVEGVWRLISSKAWDADGIEIEAPYGARPIGTIVFSEGRMLAAISGRTLSGAGANAPEYSSYGGTFELSDETLRVRVDVASDKSRIGGEQVREVAFEAGSMILRPPLRKYGERLEQRALVWQKIA